MKLYSFVFSCCILIFSACSTQKKSTVSKTKPGSENAFVKDSIEFYETDYAVNQKNYLTLLLGTWTIQTMKRQAMMAEEPLKNVNLVFNSDSTFSGNGGCNHISGRYILKGTSIKFSSIISTKMACENLELENAFLKLLEETVSAYSVSKSELWLRDGASNIIFKGVK